MQNSLLSFPLRFLRPLIMLPVSFALPEHSSLGLVGNDTSTSRMALKHASVIGFFYGTLVPHLALHHWQSSPPPLSAVCTPTSSYSLETSTSTPELLAKSALLRSLSSAVERPQSHCGPFLLAS